MSDERYTLDEARLLLAQQECGEQGHDVIVEFVVGSADPRVVLCQRCSRVWYVETEDRTRELKRRAERLKAPPAPCISRLPGRHAPRAGWSAPRGVPVILDEATNCPVPVIYLPRKTSDEDEAFVRRWIALVRGEATSSLAVGNPRRPKEAT